MDGKFKIFVIIAIVVLALAIACSTFFVMKSLDGKAQQTEVSQVEQKLELAEIPMGEAIMTNIAMESDNRQHFAKIQISIGVDTSDKKAYEALVADTTAKAASIRSEILNAIGEQTFTMLSNTKDGKEKLADEIMIKLNKLLDTELIKAVYYQEYFVQ